MPAPQAESPPERASDGTMLPEVAQPFRHPRDGGDEDKPNLFVFNDASDAERVSAEVGGETRVDQRKIDGRQYAVVREKVDVERAAGATAELWVDKPVAPGGN